MRHPFLGLDPDPRYFLLDEEEATAAVVLLAWPEEAQRDPDGAARSAREALDGWIAAGLPVRHDRGGGGPSGGRRFDIAHIVNFMRAAGLDGRDPVFPTRTVPIFRRRTERAMDVAPASPRPSEGAFRRFRVHLRREFNLAGSSSAKPLRLRIPLPYDDPTQRVLAVSIAAAPPGASATRQTANGIEAVLPASAQAASRGFVSIEACIDFAARQVEGGFDDHGAPAGGLTEAERALYLQPAENLIQVTPAVHRLAQELTATAAAPALALANGSSSSNGSGVRATFAAFWAFFHRGSGGGGLRHGTIRHSELDAADPLPHLVRRGWFDCYGGASLIVALCRAVGIPARLVHGLMLHQLAPTFHYWAEVHAEGEGWLPVDLASWDHADGGRLDLPPWSHLFLTRLEPRMKLQRFPRYVTGPIGVRFPEAWSLVSTPVPGGAATAVYDAATGQPVHRDTVRVVRLG